MIESQAEWIELRDNADYVMYVMRVYTDAAAFAVDTNDLTLLSDVLQIRSLADILDIEDFLRSRTELHKRRVRNLKRRKHHSQYDIEVAETLPERCDYLRYRFTVVVDGSFDIPQRQAYVAMTIGELLRVLNEMYETLQTSDHSPRGLRKTLSFEPL